MAEHTTQIQALRAAVAEGYILANHGDRLTKGFALLDVAVLASKCGLTPGQLAQGLRAMQADNLVVLGEVDPVAVDVALTARGIGLYLAVKMS